MKIKIVLFDTVLIASSILLFISCKKEAETTDKKSNAAYIVPVSAGSATESRTLLYSTTPYKFPVAVAIISPASMNADITIAVDNSLVDGYNSTEKTNFIAMPAGSYSLEETSLTILKDSIASQQTNLVIKADVLTPDVSYMLPVKVASVSTGSITLNAAMSTKYYIIRSPTPVIANLSNGKTATLSKGFNPQRGNDGNTNGNWGGGSVCETGPGNEEFWQVDLGAISARIDTVRVWNRTDCCDDRTAKFHVFISDVPFTGTTVAATLAQPGVYNYYNDGKAGRPTQILPKVSGRYIRLQNTTGASVTLAELTAIGIKP